MKRDHRWALHIPLGIFLILTMIPFVFAVNNIFRTNSELDHAFFAFPHCLKGLAQIGVDSVTGTERQYLFYDENGRKALGGRDEALPQYWVQLKRGPGLAWSVIRKYMLNSFIVSGLTALGTVLIGSVTAYILSRYRFAGYKYVFMAIISTMMFPGVLTLVPSFLLVKELGLLNTYWAMVFPYIAGGQVFAIFVFKSFFEGLSEDLFGCARIDGAGHFMLYTHIVLPLSKPVFSVVLIMNVLGTWNNFLWPFIVNTEGKHHVIASGLYVLATSPHAANYATLYAAYAISSIPLLLLFVYATKPFISGMTSGAFKA